MQPNTTDQTPTVTAPAPVAEPIAPPMPPTPEPSPMAIGGGETPPVPNYPTKSKLPKKTLFIGLAVFALFAGVGGYIFGFYLPNQPENVWNNGLKNSGQPKPKTLRSLKNQKLPLPPKVLAPASI